MFVLNTQAYNLKAVTRNFGVANAYFYDPQDFGKLKRYLTKLAQSRSTQEMHISIFDAKGDVHGAGVGQLTVKPDGKIEATLQHYPSRVLVGPLWEKFPKPTARWCFGYSRSDEQLYPASIINGSRVFKSIAANEVLVFYLQVL